MACLYILRVCVLCADGCAVLLSDNGIGRVKERAPAAFLCGCPIHVVSHKITLIERTRGDARYLIQCYSLADPLTACHETTEIIPALHCPSLRPRAHRNRWRVCVVKFGFRPFVGGAYIHKCIQWGCLNKAVVCQSAMTLLRAAALLVNKAVTALVSVWDYLSKADTAFMTNVLHLCCTLQYTSY